MPKKPIIQEENSIKQIEKKNFLFTSIPLYAYVLTIAFIIGIFYFQNMMSKTKTVASVNDISTDTSQPHHAYAIRAKDTGLVRPLLMIETVDEERSLLSLKLKLNEFIELKKNEGLITTASVYLNNLNTVDHIEINPNELYDPASLMKVPMMLFYLLREENKPGYLNTKLLFPKKIDGTFTPSIKNKTLVEGHSYTIRELLHYMIVYSDNQAFWFLTKNITSKDFEKLCLDFDIPINFDNENSMNNERKFIANVNSISRFFRVLYNATFLNRKNSEYALNLLSKTEFKNGILNGVDTNIKVAHKFGERTENNQSQLHEFGIIYFNNNPYLLGVMTKGTNIKNLEEIISSISKITFDEMKNNKGLNQIQ